MIGLIKMKRVERKYKINKKKNTRKSSENVQSELWSEKEANRKK